MENSLCGTMHYEHKFSYIKFSDYVTAALFAFYIHGYATSGAKKAFIYS